MVLFEAEFIEGFVKTKTSKNERALAEKFFPRLLKIQRFWPKCRGPILAEFQGWISQALKIGNTYRILVKMILFDVEFILFFIGTKTRKTKVLLLKK